MKLNKTEKKLLHIERACGDLRRGMAVFIKEENGGGIFAVSPDSPQTMRGGEENLRIGGKLIISRTRALYFFPGQDITTPIAIDAGHLPLEVIMAICASYTPVPDLESIKFSPASKIEQSALKLAKISELLPAVLTFTAQPENNKGDAMGDFLSVSTQAIESYMNNASYSLHEACRTGLILKGANDAQIIAYRPNVGAPEHYAIIIGKPEARPLVRVHSSCYTGDLLASLTCDCRDQLHSAIEIMGKGQGGIILYLMQEGRGIGLVNKLRAYEFKASGMDTVEANLALGFDDDERLFLPAAEILKKLGITTIDLLTNNPLKAAALEQYGIKITSCIPHIMETNQYNHDYVQGKVDRIGEGKL